MKLLYAEDEPALSEAVVDYLTYHKYIVDAVYDGADAYDYAMSGEYDGIILGGGHVPTQKQFFDEIHLREKLEGFDGIVMGISAGTMNSAELVYSTPELEGEAINPEYQRFLQGLGLTDIMVIPHIQKARYDVIDGLRLIEDIVVPDSKERVFWALPDGSYILQKDGKEVLYGEAIRIANGNIRSIEAPEGRLLT